MAWEKTPIFDRVIKKSDSSAVGEMKWEYIEPDNCYISQITDADLGAILYAVQPITIKVSWKGVDYEVTGNEPDVEAPVIYGDMSLVQYPFCVRIGTSHRLISFFSKVDEDTSVAIYMAKPPVPVFNDSKQVFQTDEHTVVYFDMNTGDWLIHSNNGWMNNGDVYGESKEAPVVHEARVGTAIVGTDVVAEGDEPAPPTPPITII